MFLELAMWAYRQLSSICKYPHSVKNEISYQGTCAQRCWINLSFLLSTLDKHHRSSNQLQSSQFETPLSPCCQTHLGPVHQWSMSQWIHTARGLHPESSLCLKAVPIFSCYWVSLVIGTCKCNIVLFPRASFTSSLLRHSFSHTSISASSFSVTDFSHSAATSA